ncbi:hypothetical protein [Ascidiimonas sp. W6]|uniref:hypothetical protein n=1 Tax=Ascidiimonas meishanensis TaxID=3128903 RepID=UPI0030EDD4D0
MAFTITDSENYKTQVPKKFFKKYTKTKAKLAKAKSKDANSPQVAVLENRMEGLRNQLKDYTKNQKERPKRHRAEVNYGKVSVNGTPKGTRATNLAVRGLAATAVIANAAFVGFLTSVTFASGGLAAPLTLPLAAIAITASTRVLFDSKSIIDMNNQMKSDIQKEDTEVRNKKTNPLQNEINTTNTLEQQNSNSNTIQNNASATIQTSNTPAIQNSAPTMQELQNQIKELSATVALLTQQLNNANNSAQQTKSLNDLTKLSPSMEKLKSNGIPKSITVKKTPRTANTQKPKSKKAG